MRILYLALLILIFNTPVAFGAGCADATNQTSCKALAGCEFINNACTPCQKGYYKGQNSDLCEPCPDGYDYTQITDGVGATKRELCNKFCTERTENGTKYKPSAPTVPYPNNCSYTISCVTDPDNDLCKSYALDPSNNTCYPVWTEGTNCLQGNKSTGIEIYHETDDITINYCTSKTQCNPGYHFEENNNKYYCSIAKLGQCVSDEIPCVDKLKNTCGGTISGNATCNGYKYDLSDCTCTTIKGTDLGVLKTTCSHSVTENQWTNCEKEMIHCDAGYWAGDNPNPDDCVAVGYGYYSENVELDRKKCPAGSTTSTTTASLIYSCYMTGGITKICDKNDKCITLPVEAGNISYKKFQL